MKDIIEKLVNEYGMSPKDINGCYCYGFAEDLTSILFDNNFESEMLNNELFLEIDNNDQVIGWNTKYFNKYNLEIPKYNAKQFDYYHVFTLHNGLYYDAEAPEGVNHWMELPFFKRIIIQSA
jgi:hypothetical protein